MARRKRRNFTPKFKAEAVRLVRDSSRSIPTIAIELDLTETYLRNWMAEDQSGKPGSLSVSERQELETLRREIRKQGRNRQRIKSDCRFKHRIEQQEWESGQHGPRRVSDRAVMA